MRVLLIQGANMEWLGRRQPEIYGTVSAPELNRVLMEDAARRGIDLDLRYSNIEGEAITWIYQAIREGVNGLVMNPAGFSYAGYALKDCLKGAALPYVEVHISSIAKRNIHCVLSDVAEGVIAGFGIHSYILGLDAMLEILRVKTATHRQLPTPGT